MRDGGCRVRGADVPLRKGRNRFVIQTVPILIDRGHRCQAHHIRFRPKHVDSAATLGAPRDMFRHRVPSETRIGEHKLNELCLLRMRFNHSHLFVLYSYPPPATNNLTTRAAPIARRCYRSSRSIP